MANIPLTEQEQYRYDVITKVINKEIKPGQAAKLLSVSPRQIGRLKIAVKKKGTTAIVHKLKGKQSNHRIAGTVKENAIQIIEDTYSDFKPTFATEKLSENHNIHVSYGTTRLWMIEKGLWKIRKQKKTGGYRSWRPRKEYFGEMEQFDGSYHLWFEKRFVDVQGNPIEVCLLVSIDDATGKITKASFAPNEGIAAVFSFWKAYIQTVGKPLIIYLDKFSTYKINHKAAVDNADLLTQFQRAMQDLSIKVISANSPQAKGRIERLFGTLQDRLVKEMRLAQINTPEDGNKFLKEVFIPKFNDKFAVVAEKDGDLHRVLSTGNTQTIQRIFSVQSTRRVNDDFTIQFKNRWYQLAEIQPLTVRARYIVTVEEWLDGTLHFSFREQYLTYLVLPEKPKKANTNPLILTTKKLNWKPSPDHPWRKGFKQKF